MRRAEVPAEFREYLRRVCGQVRWRRARGTVKRELLAHLQDQEEAFLEEGASVEDARKEAVRDMGDPVLVGKGMDGAYRPKRDWLLVLMVLLLTGMGVTVMVLGKQELARSAPGLLEYYERVGFWLQSLPLWMGGGLLAFLLCYLSGPLGWLKCGWVLPACYALVLAILSVLARILPGDWWYYQSNWLMNILIPLGPVFGALLLYRLHGTDFWGAGGFLLLCLLFAREYGGALLNRQIASLLLLSLFFYGIWTGWFGGFTVEYRRWWILVPAAFLLLMGSGYLWERVNGLVHNFGRDGYWEWPTYHDMKWIGMAEGEFQNWWAYGQGCLLLHAVYQVGLISVPAVLVPLLAALLRGIRDWERQRKWFGRVVSGIVVLTLALTGILELGTNFGLWGVTLMDIPFFYGGTGFVTCMALLGVLLACLRDAALIPGRKAESRRGERLRTAA